jgi:hypothetical protein
MKFTLAASALLFAGLAAAEGNYTGNSAGLDSQSRAPGPFSSKPASASPSASVAPNSRYPPPASSSKVNPWHPTTLPHCNWCTATVTCTATEWVAVDCTTVEPWTKCELPVSTCLEATLTVVIPCKTTKVPVTPIVVVTPVPAKTTPAVVVYTTPAAPTLPVFISGASNLKSGAFAGAAVAIAAAVMVFV